MMERKAPEQKRTFGSVIANALDSVAMAISPRWGASRMLARRVWDSHETRRSEDRNPQAGAYEGADSNRLHGHRWMTSNLSADSALENGQSHTTLQQRSRQLVRSDSIGGAIDTDVDHVVGTGFTPQARVVEMPGYVTEKQAKKYNKQLEAICEEISPAIDVNGKRSLWELSRLAQRHNRMDGESFTILSDVKRPDMPIPLALEIIDPDRVSTPPDKANDPSCRFGVQKDVAGRIIGYWVQQTHPYDAKEMKFKWDLIPADRVLHVYEAWFAGQTRGLPWLTRALNRIQDSKDLDEAGIIAAQIEACYAAFIKTPAVSMGQNGVVAGMASATDSSGNYLKDVQPGTITTMPPGAEITFGSPPHGDTSVPALQELNYRRIAAAMNMAYEMLLKDWRGISFAGGRLVLTGMKMDCRSRQRRLKESWFAPIWNRMVEECVLLGVVDIPPRLYAERPRLYQRHRWMAQAWQYAITPGEEVDALLKAVDGNLMTLAEAVAEHTGEDCEETLTERGREREIERELNIVPPQTTKLEMKSTPAPQKATAGKAAA